MPWVPRDLYDLMVASLRDSRGLVASAPVAPVVAAPVVEPAPAMADPASFILSPAVYEACVRFSFGDPNEKGMNLAQAKRLMRDGHSDASIIAHVRAGGQPVTA
jgi:hypothetical protein